MGGEGQTSGTTNGYVATIERSGATIEIKTINWKQDRHAILAIEQAAFDAPVRSDEEDFQEQLEKGSGILIYHEGEPAAYAIMVPLENADYRECLQDPHRNLGDTIYMESLVVKSRTTPLILRRLTRSLLEALKEKRAQRITMHVQTNTPWYQFLLRAGAKELCRYDNWQGWEKTYAYLELAVPKK